MTTTAQATLEVRALSEHVGAEATGVDLSGHVDARTRRRLREALVGHVALVIRRQRLDAKRFLAAGSLFGPPLANAYPNTAPDLPRVQLVSSHDRKEDGSVRMFGAGWHTDHADEERPPSLTALYAVELFRTGGGSTGILNMRAAYDALPQRLKATIDGLQVEYIRTRRPVRPRGDDAHGDGGWSETGPVTHPLVRTHPDTGRKNLYLHPGAAMGIVGMADEDARRLFGELLVHAIRPEFIYDHHWTLGDMLIWDNRSTMHRANYDFDAADTTQHRLMYRMMVEGERPR